MHLTALAGYSVLFSKVWRDANALATVRHPPATTLTFPVASNRPLAKPPATATTTSHRRGGAQTRHRPESRIFGDDHPAISRDKRSYLSGVPGCSLAFQRRRTAHRACVG